MPVARPESSKSRVIAHVDMDCFYVQVEQRKQPSLRGLPTAVVQYNSWKGGGLIAVGYEARKYGVKRSMRGDEAMRVCPDIHLVQVPVAHGKADLAVYRNAGSEVVSILSRQGRCERASIDEVYLDLTEAAETMLAANPPERLESIGEEAVESHILGLHLDGVDARYFVREWFLKRDADHRDKLLACGALIVAELRLEVLKKTEFTCSAGIAHNKMLAKLASGMNKPAQQTVVPQSSVKELLASLPVKKMKQLGGKLGTSLQVNLGVTSVGDLLQFSEQKLQEHYGINTGTWLWNIARGICGEEVQGRLLPKSHGSGKTFPGPQALKKVSSVQKWLYQLCQELSERLVRDLEQNKRIAHTLTLHASAYKTNDSESLKKFPSKSSPLRYGVSKLQEDAMNLFHAGLREYLGIYHVDLKEDKQQEWAITGLSISASKIVPIPSGTQSITKYFCNPNQTSFSNNVNDTCTQVVASSDEERGEHELPILNPNGHDDEETTSVSKTEVSQIPAFVKMRQQEGLSDEISLPCSGRENGLESKINKSKMNIDKPGVKSNKGKFEKGSSSILKFFHSQSIDACSSIPETQYLMNSCSSNWEQDDLQRNAWGYKSEEIDPTVLNELPPEIQEEVHAWLQPQKRARKGSNIFHYFSRTTNS